LKLASYEELPSEVDALQAVSFMYTSWQITTTPLRFLQGWVVL
jgi:hypothetical protein